VTFSYFSYKMNKHKEKQTIVVAEDTNKALKAFCEGRSIRHVPDLFKVEFFWDIVWHWFIICF